MEGGTKGGCVRGRGKGSRCRDDLNGGKLGTREEREGGGLGLGRGRRHVGTAKTNTGKSVGS